MIKEDYLHFFRFVHRSGLYRYDKRKPKTVLVFAAQLPLRTYSSGSQFSICE